ncbi:MAG: tolB protein precursor [Solirubrobacterales bacterium]|nr:tolB protein precursor [Solirubrobacterales bacterium]
MARLTWIAVLGALVAGLVAGPAGATAPGRNGLIAYTAGGAIHTIGSDGRGDRVLLRDAAQPAWSPGGNALAFRRGGDVWVASVDGRRAHRLVAGGSSPTWSSDGRRIAYVAGDGYTLRSIASAGGRGARARVIGRTGDSPWPDYYRGGIDGSPSGDQLAYYGVFDFGATLALDLTRVRFEGTGIRVLLDTSLPGRDGWAPSGNRVSWSPDGRTLAYDAIDYAASGTTGATGVATGPAALATTQVAQRRSSFHRSLTLTSPDWSPSGRELCGTVAGGLGLMSWPGGTTRVIVTAPGTGFPDCDWQTRPR